VPKPAVPKPVAPKPVAPKPVAPKPVAPKTVVPKTVAPKTVAPKPVVSKVGSSKPAPNAAGASRAVPTAAAAPKPSSKKPSKAPPAEPPPTGPAKPRTYPKGGPAKADLKRYRDALLARRRALMSSSKELAAEALQAGGGDFSVDHMADHGSDNYEQDFNLKLLEGEAGQLVDIRDALAKLDGKGEFPFGVCEGCADEPQGRCPTCPWIPASRLDAIPQARLCVQMKEREESRG
jgi:RNA polymerase-binding transcription factor DksA